MSDSQQLHAACLSAFEPREEQECQRLGCTREDTSRVRFEGDPTTRRLCPYHSKHFRGCSS